MDDFHVSPTESTRKTRFYRFGLKTLLTLVVTLGLILGYIAREHRRAQERVEIVVQLTSMNVHPEMEEPTSLGLWVRKRLPNQEPWIRDQIGAGWFSYPTVFVCRNLEDRMVPKVLNRFKKLGTVQEILLKGNKLTDRGEAELYAGLPTANVAPLDDPTLHQYYLRSQVRAEHFATGALAIDSALFLGLPASLILSMWLVRKRRNSEGNIAMAR